MLVRPVLFLVALGLLSAAGCGPAKLNENKTYTVDAGEANGLVLPAIGSAQKVTVEFTSSAAEVTVLLFKLADTKDDSEMVTIEAKKALGQQKGKEGSFTTDVPENTSTRVVVRGANAKTEVKLKVTNAK